MDSYTITITPNDDSGHRTTLVVKASDGKVQITDVHLHAADGLTGAQMPSVDLRLLLKAVAGLVGSPSAITATVAPAQPPADAPAQPPADAPAQPPADAPAWVPATEGSAAADVVEATPPQVSAPPAAALAETERADEDATPTSTVPPASAPAAATRPTRRRAAVTAESKATETGGRRGGRKPSKARKRTPSATVEAAGSERVYRRMPEDLAAVYQQARTAAAVADHYEVPRHTAQGWIRRFKATNPPTRD